MGYVATWAKSTDGKGGLQWQCSANCHFSSRNVYMRMNELDNLDLIVTELLNDVM